MPRNGAFLSIIDEPSRGQNVLDIIDEIFGGLDRNAPLPLDRRD